MQSSDPQLLADRAANEPSPHVLNRMMDAQKKMGIILVEPDDDQLTVLPIYNGVYRRIYGTGIVDGLCPDTTAIAMYCNGFGQLFSGKMGSQIYLHQVEGLYRGNGK